MQKFFRVFSFVLCLIIFGAANAAHCRGEAGQPGKYKILASTFPVYLMVKNVCVNAQNVEVELLIPASAGCPHDFALRPGDMLKLNNAGALVINGAELEEFLIKPLESLKKDLPIIDAGKGIDLLPDLTGHEHGNPHIFAGPAQAAQMAKNIGEGLGALNPENARQYKDNAKKYSDELMEISQKFAALGKEAGNNKIGLGHDSLAYLAEDANLKVVVFFDHADSVAALSKIKKEIRTDSPALLVGDSQYPDRLLKTLAAETNLPWIVLNSCASGPENPPLDYYQKVMLDNFHILQKALPE